MAGQTIESAKIKRSIGREKSVSTGNGGRNYLRKLRG
jgi:hypothetical protein